MIWAAVCLVSLGVFWDIARRFVAAMHDDFDTRELEDELAALKSRVESLENGALAFARIKDDVRALVERVQKHDNTITAAALRAAHGQRNG